MISLLNNKNTPQLCRLNPAAALLWLIPYNCHQSTGFDDLQNKNNYLRTPHKHRKNFSSNHQRLPLALVCRQFTTQITIDTDQSITPRL
jgi:hypothetical protein